MVKKNVTAPIITGRFSVNFNSLADTELCGRVPLLQPTLLRNGPSGRGYELTTFPVWPVGRILCFYTSADGSPAPQDGERLNQKVSFMATWPMRAAFAFVTKPKSELRKFPFGSANCAWLKTLKNSARNSSSFDSVNLRSFKSAMSQLFRPGPAKKRRLDVPTTPSGSALNKLVLKYGLVRVVTLAF